MLASCDHGFGGAARADHGKSLAFLWAVVGCLGSCTGCCAFARLVRQSAGVIQPLIVHG